MTQSILQDEERCYITRRTTGLQRHHVIYGDPNRKNSEKHGLWVYLAWELHTGDAGIHNGNTNLDMALKLVAQSKFEETHTREEFMQIFGQSWL